MPKRITKVKQQQNKEIADNITFGIWSQDSSAMAEATRFKDLKLQPYRQNSVSLRSNLKLSSRFYGPYRILEKVGPVAYRLDLPDGSRVHPVFHISLLKKKLSSGTVPSPQLPIPTDAGSFALLPAVVIDRRLITRGREQVSQLLIRWENESSDLCSWEDEKFLKKKFPTFDPCGQGSQIAGSNVVNTTSVLEGKGMVVGEVAYGEELKVGALEFSDLGIENPKSSG